MIAHELLTDQGILIVRPQQPLQREDFEAVAREVDPYIEEHGALKGLLIEAESFPGWENLAAMVAHFRFIRDHHTKIARVAAVSDSKLLSVLPRITGHFVAADVRHFSMSAKDEALAWLGQS